MTILKANSVNIEFNRKKVLSNIDFSIETGLTAIVGPEKSGKSSIVRVLATLLKCKTGSLRLDDLNYKDDFIEIRKKVGYIPENINLYSQLTGKEFLEIVYEIKMKENDNRDRTIKEIIDYVGIDKYKNEFINNYDQITKCRLALAQSILGDNKIVLIDSMLKGLEVNEKKIIMELISDISKKRIVILTTEDIEDILEYYDSLIIISKGNIKLKGNRKEVDEKIKEFGCMDLKEVYLNYLKEGE